MPGFGFDVVYKRQEHGVWFPSTFGTEFQMHAFGNILPGILRCSTTTLPSDNGHIQFGWFAQRLKVRSVYPK